MVTESDGRVVIFIHSMKDVDGFWVQEKGRRGREGGGEGRRRGGGGGEGGNGEN